MHAPTAKSPLTSRAESWLERERASGRLYDRAAIGSGVFLIAMLGLSFWLLRYGGSEETVLSTPVIALLLVANLIPAIALMVLLSRKIALRRAERGGLGSGRLHIRLVGTIFGDRRRSDGSGCDFCFAAAPKRPRILVFASCSYDD